MNKAIEQYNATQTPEEQTICNTLMHEIENQLTTAESKLYHGHPVWFLEDNPIVGYSKLKDSIQLLFWSGQTFQDTLTPTGKYQAAEKRYTNINQLNINDLTRWLTKSKTIQWDYKNIVKRKGILERLK